MTSIPKMKVVGTRSDVFQLMDKAYMDGWNKAISAAVKVADKKWSSGTNPNDVTKWIVEAIKGLKKEDV